VLAGGAYVPLDPSYPKNRLSQIIDTARIRHVEVLLGSKEESWLRTEWPNVIILGVSLHETKVNFSLPDQQCFGDKLLYVLFTSGSTGQPKGVPGFESGVLKRLEYWWKTCPHEPDEVTMHHITYNWVDHIMEVWNALLTGRELLIIPDVPSLLNTIETPPSGVRRVLLVPTLLRMMLRIVDSKGKPPAFLSLVMVSGEPLPAKILNQYQKLVPDGTLVNIYGMTEVYGDCTASVYSPDRLFNARDRVSIGKSIIDFVLEVRDLDNGQLISEIGKAGELYVSGACVVPGYYAHGDGVIVADPKAVDRFCWHQSRDARMFQTGDLVAWRSDGELDHMGRADDQVKVNGVRTELGDISAAALRCNGIESAAAVASLDAQDATRVVLFAAPEVPADKLMLDLAKHLPSIYMPAALVPLPHLPSLPNGKLDRKFLESAAAHELKRFKFHSGDAASVNHQFVKETVFVPEPVATIFVTLKHDSLLEFTPNLEEYAKPRAKIVILPEMPLCEQTGKIDEALLTRFATVYSVGHDYLSVLLILSFVNGYCAGVWLEAMEFTGGIRHHTEWFVPDILLSNDMLMTYRRSVMEIHRFANHLYDNFPPRPLIQGDVSQATSQLVQGASAISNRSASPALVSIHRRPRSRCLPINGF